MVLVSVLALLFALAGLYTIFGVGMRMTALEMTAKPDMRAMPGMAGMPAAEAPGRWSGAYAILVFLMWWVMMVAMMLPSVAPTVMLYSALLRRGAAAARVPLVSTAFLAGYLAAWAGFAAVAATAQWGLEAAGLVSPRMMTLLDSAPGAIVLIAAGLFQFTRLKATCLRHCRSPAEFIAQRRRPGAGGAFAMGVEHGVYCVGCCWFLMALLFVGGIMDLYWIVGLATFVALEKLTRFGETVSRLAGAVLIVWGGYILAAAL